MKAAVNILASKLVLLREQLEKAREKRALAQNAVERCESSIEDIEQALRQLGVDPAEVEREA